MTDGNKPVVVNSAQDSQSKAVAKRKLDIEGADESSRQASKKQKRSRDDPVAIDL